MLGHIPTDIKIDLDASKDNTICHICSDVATGRHYGAIACNGCKGFFRRTVRRNYDYHCRFDSKCEIDKVNRAVCRYCRFMKCISSGMRDDQVQSERDVIGKRDKKDNMRSYRAETPRASPELAASSPNDEYDVLLDSLIQSEQTIQSLRDTVITQTGHVEYTARKLRTANNCRMATLNDVLKSMHSQLLLVIEWAKTLPEFLQLSPADQAALLKSFAGQHVTLCVAYRSVGAKDALKLLNDLYIPRASKTDDQLKDYVDGFYLKDCEKVMDQLVEPMKFLNLDNKEFVALKACVLFNPVAPGLTPQASTLVLSARRKVFAAFERYVKQTKPLDTSRVGDLTFFILTPLSYLAKSISEDLMFTKVSGFARIDILMEELILAETDFSEERAGLTTQNSISTINETTAESQELVDQSQEQFNTVNRETFPNGDEPRSSSASASPSSVAAGLLLKTDDVLVSSGIATPFSTPQPPTPQFPDTHTPHFAKLNTPPYEPSHLSLITYGYNGNFTQFPANFS